MDLTTVAGLVPVLLGSSVIGGLLTAAITGIRDSSGKRRDGYAKVTKALVARAEYPYRVRRRTSDSPEALAELTELGSEIQEDLAAARVWVRSECGWLADIFDETISKIDEAVSPATKDAWNELPIANASGMNLGDWGPGTQNRHIHNFTRKVRWRFGWRRLVP